MAKIEDLIRQVSDERLREELASEVRELKKQKHFGLVFEEHLPEMLRLPKAPIRLGNVVAHRDSWGSEVWRVLEITGKKAKCRQPLNPTKYDQEVLRDFPLDELVLVVRFGEPIYPVLTSIDRVERGGSDKPRHILINADNYHALQLLLYSHERKIDLIYIDPPYNTGARDWKYNNDYVDRSDIWRHSKWLSMMKKRLLLAKRLLKPDGVLVIAIDENEHASLKLLLSDLLRGYSLETVVVNHHPQGSGGDNVSFTHEYAIVCVPEGMHRIQGASFEGETEDWGLIKAGAGHDYSRSGRPRMFYAIHVDKKTGVAQSVGPELALKDRYPLKDTEDGLRRVYPLSSKGDEKRWRYGRTKMESLIAAGKIRASIPSFSMKVTVSRKGSRRPIYSNWVGPRYNAGAHGTSLLRDIFGDSRFPFPKSLYTTEDFLASATADKPNAIVLDFFAGSGTTLHSTLLLNAEDGGTRACILVTNNEVEEKFAVRLRTAGSYPGDASFEKHGICENVTWPRCKCVLQGHREDRSPLPGKYLSGREFKEGFQENVEYFRLDFVDPALVERGDAFEGILPILWMIAGAIGEREPRRGTTPWYLAKHSPFAVLIRETKFGEFRKALRERPDISRAFLVTDSDDNFTAMRRDLGRRYRCIQLYKSYLENFRINTVDRHAAGDDEESE